MFLVTNFGLFAVNKTTGAATQIGSPLSDTSYNNDALATDTDNGGLSSGAFVGNTLYAGPDNAAEDNLYSVNTATGHALPLVLWA